RALVLPRGADGGIGSRAGAALSTVLSERLGDCRGADSGDVHAHQPPRARGPDGAGTPVVTARRRCRPADGHAGQPDQTPSAAVLRPGSPRFSVGLSAEPAADLQLGDVVRPAVLVIPLPRPGPIAHTSAFSCEATA